MLGNVDIDNPEEDNTGIFLTGFVSRKGFIPEKGVSGLFDLFTLALDKDGQQLMADQIGGAGTEAYVTPHIHAVDRAWNHYLVATTDSNPTWATGQCPTCGKTDFLIAKYNKTGGRVWVRQHGTPHLDAAYAIAASPSGRVFIAGTTDGKLPRALCDGTCGDPDTTPGVRNIFVAEISRQNGDLKWVSQFPGGEQGTVVTLSGPLLIDESHGVYVIYSRRKATSTTKTTYMRKLQAGVRGHVWARREYTVGDVTAVTGVQMMPNNALWLVGYTEAAMPGPYGQIVPLFYSGDEVTTGFILQLDASTGATKFLNYCGSLISSILPSATNGSVFIAGVDAMAHVKQDTSTFVASISAKSGRLLWQTPIQRVQTDYSNYNQAILVRGTGGALYTLGTFLLSNPNDPANKVRAVVSFTKINLITRDVDWSSDIKLPQVEGKHAAEAKALVLDRSGGIYGIGTVLGSFPDIVTPVEEPVETDAWVAKLEADTGKVTWVKQYGGEGLEYVMAAGRL